MNKVHREASCGLHTSLCRVREGSVGGARHARHRNRRYIELGMWELESAVAAEKLGIRGLFVVGDPAVVAVGFAAGVVVENLVGVAKVVEWRAAVGWRCLESGGM